MTEDNGAMNSEVELCPTCGRAWGDSNGSYCSNSWHLATPYVMQQIVKLQSELAAAKESLKELLPLSERSIEGMARHEIIYAPGKMNKVEVAEIIDRAKKLTSS
jgi:hypothetical protein